MGTVAENLVLWYGAASPLQVGRGNRCLRRMASQRYLCSILLRATLVCFSLLSLNACRSPYADILSGFTSNLGSRPVRISIQVANIQGAAEFRDDAQALIDKDFKDILTVVPDSALALVINGTEPVDHVRELSIAVQSEVVHPVRIGGDLHPAEGQFVWASTSGIVKEDSAGGFVRDGCLDVLSAFRKRLAQLTASKTPERTLANAKAVLANLVRCLTASFGFVLLYLGAFLRRDEQGKVQDVLQRMWVFVNDASRRSVSRFISFLSEVGRLTAQGLDRIFGSSLFSWQAYAVAILYTIASAKLGDFVIANRFYLLGQSPPVWILLSGVSAIAILVCFLVMPFAFSTRTWRLIALFVAPLAVAAVTITNYFLGVALDKSNSDPMPHSIAGYFIAGFTAALILIGAAIELGCLAIVKRLLRRNYRRPSMGNTLPVLISMSAILAVGVMCVLFPSWLSMPRSRMQLVGMLLATIATTQIVASVGSLIFLALIVAALLNRIALPMADRVIYAAQDYELVRHRVRLLLVGACLLTWSGFPVVGDALTTLFKLIGG